MADEQEEASPEKVVKTSRTRAQTLISHPTDQPGATQLVQVVQITCEICDVAIGIQIPGHHIPVVIKALQKAMELYPELCKEHVTEIPKGATYVEPGGSGKAN